MSMKANKGVTRRGFLLMIAAFGVFVGVALPPMRSRVLRRIVGPKLLRLDQGYPMGKLSNEESETIAVLIRVLVQGDHAFLRDHVARRTTTEPGYLREYQEGAKLLNAATRHIFGGAKRFEELDHTESNLVLESILWKYRAGDKWRKVLERLFVSKRRLAFRKFVVRDILKAFYRSGPGWQVVGYTKYPGIPANDLLEYTRPLGK
jgi:hypothetical protein